MIKTPSPLLRPSLLAIILAAISSFPLTAAAALPNSAADMDAAHGKDAEAIADAILKAAPPSGVPRNHYATKVITEFSGELVSTNPDARYNTAKIFALLETLSCDHLLEQMLKNPDPAVRWWAANGLGRIAPIEKIIGGTSQDAAVQALHDAQKTETADTVKPEITKALSQY